MTCPEARERFSDLVDDALAPDARASLDEHLAGCVECREELQRFRGVVSLVRAVEPERAPIGFVDRVLARTQPAPWSVRLVWKVPLGAAAAVLLAVLVSLLYRQTPELQQAARRETAPPSAVVEAPAVSQAPAPPAEPPARAPAAPQEAAPAARDARASKPAAPEPSASEPAEPLRNKLEAAREPDLVGHLAVADFAAAEQALASLVASSAGRQMARRSGQDSLELDVEIPRARAEEFTRGLANLGRWQASRAAESPGDLVRVRIRLVR